MHEEDRRALSSHLDGEVDAVHHHPLNLAGIAAAHFHEGPELGRHGDRVTVTIDADEHELRCCDEGVVLGPARRLTHGEAGATAMDERLLEAQDVPGKGGGVIVDHGLPHCWPGTGTSEHVHPRPSREHLPSSPLEEAQEGRLIQVTEGVALVGVHSQVD